MRLKFHSKINTEVLPRSEGETEDDSLSLGGGVLLRGGDSGGIREEGIWEMHFLVKTE